MHRLHSTLYQVEHHYLVWISSLHCILIYGMDLLHLLKGTVKLLWITLSLWVWLLALYTKWMCVQMCHQSNRNCVDCRLQWEMQYRKEIKRLESEGIIEKVDSSPWVSPLVAIQKKSGGIRLCVDLREPNKAVIIDSHPLPHIEEVFTELRGASMFSTIDLQNAYHQVSLHQDSRDLTALLPMMDFISFYTGPLWGWPQHPVHFKGWCHKSCLVRMVCNVI